MGFRDLKPWIKGGVIGIFVSIILFIIHISYFGKEGLFGLVFLPFGIIIWFIIGIGGGLIIQKKIGRVLKIIIFISMFSLVIYSVCSSILKGYSECAGLGGTNRCNFIDWIGGLACPVPFHGMFLLAPAFILSLILIILSVIKLLKDKEILANENMA